MADKKTVMKLFATLIEDECLGRSDCCGCPFEKAEMCGYLDGTEIATELRKCADGVDENEEIPEPTEEEIPEPDGEIGFNSFSGCYDFDC